MSVVLPEPFITKVHHLLMNNTAQLLGKLLVNNKKISFRYDYNVIIVSLVVS